MRAMLIHLPCSITQQTSHSKIAFSLIKYHLLLARQRLEWGNVAQRAMRVIVVNIREAVKPAYDIINQRE